MTVHRQFLVSLGEVCGGELEPVAGAIHPAPLYRCSRCGMAGELGRPEPAPTPAVSAPDRPRLVVIAGGTLRLN